MAGMAQYLRKSLALLDWIDSSHASARVILGSRNLGSWKDLEPRWKLTGQTISLQIVWRNRRRLFQLSSVLPSACSAILRCHSRRHGCEDILVTWDKEAQAQTFGQGDLLERARAFLRRMLPGCRILSVSHAVDRTHSLSGKFLRLRARYRQKDHLLVVCHDGIANEEVPAILTQGLLWLYLLRHRERPEYEPTIHLLVPAGYAPILCHRSRFLNHERAHLLIWEHEEDASGEWQVHRPSLPKAPLEDHDFCWPFLGPFRWSPLLARVIDLAPGMIQRYPRFKDYDSLRIHGLEFAKATGRDRDRLYYGVGSHQPVLTDENFADCRALVDEILYYRRADSPAPDHPYYRMQPERWLEGLLLADAASLFPELQPGAVYPQIPVYLDGRAGRVDILGSDRRGNLVVMELKVTADPEMALQSLDYWGRVIVHNRDGDFEKRGYFPELRLSRARPRIYLVSPVFQFHDSLEPVLRHLDPGLEIVKISINEDWRCGVKILRRTAFLCGNLE